MTKLLALAACFFAACVPDALPQAVHPGDLPPLVARVAPDQRVATWNRAITVLLDEGYVPQILNQDAAYISAKRRDAATDTDELAGTNVIVTISPQGAVRVEIAGAGVYTDGSQLARDLQVVQTRLTAEITAAPAST
ncbi:MAG TPA: hypothetical protein VGG74_02590 [Kofleriaceae bacterium]|jgi:hypothetical protein